MMTNQPKMSAAELGALWMTYQKNTLILRFLECFIEKSDDEQAIEMMDSLWHQLHSMSLELETMFENDGTICPNGFTKEDVHLQAAKLFDNGFDILFSRILKEISMGMYVLHMTTAYREDIILFYQKLSNITETYYRQFTQYLLEKGLLTRPNFTTMPTSTGYITSTNYLKGSNLFGEKRVVNAVEYGTLYHSLEMNITGMQLMAGFAQCAKDEQVRKYFVKGRELSKEMANGISEILLEHNIQAPTSPVGFNASFILRHDMTRHTTAFAKDVYEFAIEGAKLMMEKGWMEEPPKMDV